MVTIHAYNNTGRDQNKRHSEVARFDLTCISNTQLELRGILEEEAHKKDERRQKMLEDIQGNEETKEG